MATEQTYTERRLAALANKLFYRVYGQHPALKTTDADTVQEMYEWMYSGDKSGCTVRNLSHLVTEWCEYNRQD